jgi:hypothetical protein
MSTQSADENGVEKINEQPESQIDLLSYHEQHAGRHVVDPQ